MYIYIYQTSSSVNDYVKVSAAELTILFIIIKLRVGSGVGRTAFDITYFDLT